ncbi:MAG: type I phosphomannose isomerase catalytic subunit [Pirellulaceae bacterium]|nr:type I phosphomannose isomerase catalytic subunit [Pirellulaceae bacterium]
MSPTEPLFFRSIFRSYIWGGTRLKSFLNKPVPSGERWAESWEIVDHGDDQSCVTEGPWKDWTLRRLIERFPVSILGRNATPQSSFPLLLKYLDCHRVLSVQVHPNDDYALKMTPPDLGKTEAWYVIDATDDALLYAGMKPGTNRQNMTEALKEGRTEECLHRFHPKKGDCVFIPAGTVHALGAGLIVAEIQQASNTTFRLFDWNRVESDGKARPLHIEQALEVIDFDKGPVRSIVRPTIESSNGRVLVDCDKFRLLELNQSTKFDSNGMFQIVTVVHGTAELIWATGKQELLLGQSALVPAACMNFELQLGSDATVLIATAAA